MSLSEELDSYKARSAGREKAVLELGKLIKEAAEDAHKLGEELSDARSLQRILEDELRSALRDKEKLEREFASEIQAEESQPEPLAELESAREAALHALAARSADAKFAEERLRESERRLGEARGRLEAAIRRRNSEIQAESARARRAEAVQPEREKLARQISEEETRRSEAILRGEAAREALTFLKALKESRLQDRAQEEAAATAARQSLADAGAAVHASELNRMRSEARRSAALSRLGEEYGIWNLSWRRWSCHLVRRTRSRL